MASLIFDASAALGDIVSQAIPGLLSFGLLLWFWLAFVPLLSPLKLTRLQTITFICPVDSLHLPHASSTSLSDRLHVP